MKCMLLKDHHADVTTIRDEDKPKLKFWKKKVRHRTKGLIDVAVPYYPAGTIFEHNVIGFIMTGQAAPADEEARQACGLSEAELAKIQNIYNRLLAGVGEADAELFDMGVITGYDTDGNYKHGPNWDSYHEAKGQAVVAAKSVDEGI